MYQNKLTELNHWNDYWESVSLPSEIKKTKKGHYLNEILKVFDKNFQHNPKLSIIEIGGSPGQYLAYMYKNFGYKIHCLDYSEIGCIKTEENFQLLNIPCEIIKKDLFTEENKLPLFDIVYSLGFIEHFLDIDIVIEKHLRLLKIGGLLLVGMPNLRGINYFFFKMLAPILLSKHNLKVMEIGNWKSFEQKFNLQPVFKGFVGGFEPLVFNRWEKKTVITFIFKLVAKLLSLLLSSHFKFLRRFNSKYFSGYIIGVYKKLHD